MPHFRLPAFDHELVSALWAVFFGAFIYFGSVSVGVHDHVKAAFAALENMRARAEQQGAS